MIVLLDLNFTLVSNSWEKKSPFIRQIENEKYRGWLIDLFKNDEIILITARPTKYKEVTLQKLATDTDIKLSNSYFNEANAMPHLSKKYILDIYLAKDDKFIEELNKGNVIAIESNPKTRAMYKTYNIKSYLVKGDILQDEQGSPYAI